MGRFISFFGPRSSAAQDGSSRHSYWNAVSKPEILPAWLGVGITLAASIIALLALGDIKKQTGISWQATKAAKLAADTASLVQLPTLFLFRCEIRDQDFKQPHEWMLNPSVATAAHNYGQTPAFIVSWSVGLHYNNEPKGMAGEAPLGKVIEPGTHEWLPTVTLEDSTATLAKAEEIRNGNGWYTVNGIVTYDDLFGNRKIFKFCRCLKYKDGKIIVSEG